MDVQDRLSGATLKPLPIPTFTPGEGGKPPENSASKPVSPPGEGTHTPPNTQKSPSPAPTWKTIIDKADKATSDAIHFEVAKKDIPFLLLISALSISGVCALFWYRQRRAEESYRRTLN